MNPTLDGALEILQGDGRFGLRDRFFIGAKLIHIGQGLPLTREEGIATSLIFLHPESAVLNSNKRNELSAIVLDEKNIVITHLELWRIGYLHRPAVHRASQHTDRVVLSRITLQRVHHLESDESNNAMLGPFSNPLRLQPGDFAFENNLRPTDEFIKIRRDNGRRVNDETQGNENGKN